MMTMTSASTLLVLILCCVDAKRIVIPFGQGWRYHLGDAPDGPSYGSGALATFIPRAQCAPMSLHKEWTPAGNKDAGQPYTPCAIACSYDPSCTAYDDGGGPGGLHKCYFGNASTTCTALVPTPAPTPATYRTAVPYQLINRTWPYAFPAGTDVL